ncbi:UvrD-helicase domain-containing protein [Aquirufa ecclesiirivi]|uniref:UvrD-helicase domain-containing protein n=1 Tax=Aquirufa ecclesiirivi TaxID=2715124 RepID=UPI0022A85EF6|nr:UvrD-helicase domain-containing protein [Aquirufa ecclesiirivi]MCZ2472175.1 UvrD-helicase domain-containing protein [Aquirufa ecclesiirivi]
MLASPLQLFSASAGSGKTYTLTLEYIKLSLHEVEPRGYFRRILAVTFTIKAAEEMRTRIIKALSGISAYPAFVDMAEKEISESNQLLRRIQEDLAKEGIELTLDELATRAYITLQQILQDYGLFSVMTIDAFVQRLSSSFVEELHLPSQFEVILDINSLMNDLMDQLLDKVNQSGDPVLTDLILSFARQEVIDGRNWNRIRQSLIDFLKISFDENYFGIKQEMEVFSMSDFLKIEHQINTKIDSIENQIVEISQEIVNLADSLHKEESYFANGVKGPINAFRKFANGQSLKIDKYSSIRNAIDQNKWHASKVDPITKSQIDGISNQLTDLATEFIQLYEEEISKYLLFKLIVKDLKKIALISSINEEYQVYQHEQSSISIAEFARRINEIISQDPVPFIYEKLGDRYFHILIDEFQDTSILQWKNFMPLLENTVSLGKRNLLVGDAKQSIYKFRGGEVGLIASLTAQNPQLLGDKFNQSEFDQVRLDYLMNQIQLNQLESNYRSAPEIVEFNNAFFSWISNQPTYQGFCALLEPVYGHSMTQIPQVSSTALSGQVDMLVFQKPVITTENKELEAKWMLQNVIQLIEYNVTAGFRLGDIALLTRKNKDAKFLALQLKEAGYPIISADSLLVYYSSLVAFILALLKMKVDPQKPILLFEAAYALADIHGQAISLEALNFLQKESTFNSNQSMVLNQYVLEFYSIQMESLWEDESLLDSVYHTIAIFDLFSRAEGSEYVLKLLDIIQDFTLKNASSISDFLAYFDLNKHSFSISCPENVDAITITSIHKSKGLEYPVVILPFASWTHQASDRDKIWFKLDLQEEEFVLEEKGALPYFYARANANDLDQFEQLASQKQQEKDAIFLDALNMLYVACTRAKQHLHILFSEPNLESHFKTKSTFEQSIGKLLLEYLQTCKTESEELPSFMDLEFEDISKYYVLSKSTSFIQKQRSIDSEIHLSLKLDAKTSAKPLLRVRSEQADLYTLAKEKRERGEVIHKQLENLKSYEDINQDEVLPEILELLEMDEIKQFFKPGELFISEEDILLPNGNMIRPDRVIKQNQTLIVVDYKTGKKKDSHQSQVNSYCEALRQMGYPEVKGAIIYTMDKAVEYV